MIYMQCTYSADSTMATSIIMLSSPPKKVLYLIHMYINPLTKQNHVYSIDIQIICTYNFILNIFNKTGEIKYLLYRCGSRQRLD